MSELDTHWKPKRMLQRALTTSIATSGNPAFKDVFTESNSESSPSGSLFPSSLGASIKRKLQDAMPLVRSISLRSPSGSRSAHKARRQNRAFSADSSTTRPHIVHTYSPESINVAQIVPQVQPVVQSPKPSQSHFIPRRPSMADVDIPHV